MRALAVLTLSWLFTVPLLGATVTNWTVDNFGNALNSPLTITPLSTPTSNGVYVINGPARTIQPVTGKTSFTLLSGNYRVTQGATSYIIAVPDDTNTYNINSLASSNLVIYSYTNGLGFPGLVRVTTTDTAPGVLGDKLTAGNGIALTTNNAGGDSALVISSTASERTQWPADSITNAPWVEPEELIAATNSLDPFKLIQQSASVGQVLKWDGAKWTPSLDAIGEVGTGIDQDTAITIAADEARKATNILAANIAAGYSTDAERIGATNTIWAATQARLVDVQANSVELTNNVGTYGFNVGTLLQSTNIGRLLVKDDSNLGEVLSGRFIGAVSGTNIDNATITTNKLTASAYAALVGGGSGTGDASLAGTNVWTGSNYYNGPFVIGGLTAGNSFEVLDAPGGNIVGYVRTNGQASFNLFLSTNLPQSGVTGLEAALAWLTNNAGGSAPSWELVSTDTNGIAWWTNSQGQLMASNTGAAYSLAFTNGIAGYLNAGTRTLTLSNSAGTGGGAYPADIQANSVALTNNAGAFTFGVGTILQSTNIGRLLVMDDGALGQVLSGRFIGSLSGTNIDAGTIASNKLDATAYAAFMLDTDTDTPAGAVTNNETRALTFQDSLTLSNADLNAFNVYGNLFRLTNTANPIQWGAGGRGLYMSGDGIIEPKKDNGSAGSIRATVLSPSGATTFSLVDDGTFGLIGTGAATNVLFTNDIVSTRPFKTSKQFKSPAFDFEPYSSNTPSSRFVPDGLGIVAMQDNNADPLKALVWGGRTVPAGYAIDYWTNGLAVRNGAGAAYGDLYAANIFANGQGVPDTNWVLQQVASLGIHIYTSGTTNAGALDVRTNNWQGWSTPVTSAKFTNTISNPALDSYIRHIVSTNTITRLGDGPIAIRAYLYKGVVGAISIHPEVYLFDTVGGTLAEIGSAPDQSIASGAPALYQWSISVGSTNLANPNKIVVGWKVGAKTSTPDVSFVAGQEYDSHISFAQSLASATINGSQIVDATISTNKMDATAHVAYATDTGVAINTRLTSTNQGAVNLDMGKEWSFFSTNDNFTISGLLNTDSGNTLVQKHTMIITNSAGSTKTMTVPASFIISGGTTFYITNQAVLTLIRYPGAGTNAAFKCLK